MEIPNLLIISGNGRNSGKTSLACKIIQKFSTESIIAIKISPHFHSINERMQILYQSNYIVITEENSKNSDKDSSRMLQAGAEKVFYLQVEDKYLKKAFKKLLGFIDNDALMVCESGWLRTFVEPGLFLLVNRPEKKELKNNFQYFSRQADKIILFDDASFHPDVKNVNILKNHWILTLNS